MADDAYEQDEIEVVGLPRSKEQWRIRTLRQYGSGDYDPYCRERNLKMAARSRLTDRDIELNESRGGDTVHLVLETGEPETYTIFSQTWFVGSKVKVGAKRDGSTEAQDGRLNQEQKDAIEGGEVRNLPGNLLFFRELGKDGLEDNYYLEVPAGAPRCATYQVTHQVIACDLWDPKVVGVPFSLVQGDDPETEVLTPEEIEARIGALTPEEQETAYLGHRIPVVSMVRPQFVSGQHVAETDELSEGIAQEISRFNFNTLSRVRLNRELSGQVRTRREQPGKWVEYVQTGISPKGQRADKNILKQLPGGADNPLAKLWGRRYLTEPQWQRLLWREPLYHRACLRKVRHDLPLGLRYNRQAGRYEVRTGHEDIDALRVRAHNVVARHTRDAKSTYEQLMEALVNKAVRGNENEKLQAWEILVRFGENGLRVGSQVMLDWIDNYLFPPQNGRRWRGYQAARARFEYDTLYAEMRRVLYREYGVVHSGITEQEYVPFWSEKDHEVRYGGESTDPKNFWYTPDPEDPNKLRAHRCWVDLADNFFTSEFDPIYPSEQYTFRKHLSRVYGAHDKKSYRSRAKALQRLVAMTLHVITPPKTRWVYSVDSKGVGEWKLEIDWSFFDYFCEGIEAFRDWVRKLREWQMSKSGGNSFDSMSFEARTADSLRSNDWGGFRNPIPAWASWAFWLLRLVAEKFAPMPFAPTAERPERQAGETATAFRARLNHWVERYGPLERNPGEAQEAYNQRKKAWEAEKELHRAEDVEAFDLGVMARVAILGWPWYDRRLEDSIPHDGALRVLSAVRWADWLAMIGSARSFNSTLGDGMVPELDDFLKDYSTKSRNYRNETEWFESDEGALLDPQSIWGYLGGVLRPHIVNILNYRLYGVYKDDFLKVRFETEDPKRETATMVRSRLEQMWRNVPLKGVRRRIWKIWYDALDEHVVHVRPLIARFLTGLPTDMVERLQPLIRGLNRRSDVRVKAWAAHLARGLVEGKRAFTNAQKFIDEGYGTNLYPNEDPKKAQERQDDLGFLAWMNPQYDKAVPFVRGFILRNHFKVFVRVEEEWEHVIKVIESGLYVDLAWELLEIVSQHSLFLSAQDFAPNLDEFKKKVFATEIEQKFETRVRKVVSEGVFKNVVEGRLFPLMQYVEDPYEEVVA